MQLLKIAVAGTSDLTLRLLELCYEDGHEITNVFSTRSDIQDYASKRHISLDSDGLCDANWIIVTDDVGDIFSDVDKSTHRLICCRQVAKDLNTEHWVNWVVKKEETTSKLLCWSERVCGGQISGADAIWDCDQTAIVGFKNLLRHLARGLSIERFEEKSFEETSFKETVVPPVLRSQAIRHRSNETSRQYAYAPNLVEEFAKAVTRYPKNVALIFGEQSLTYTEFDALSSRLAEMIVQMYDRMGVVISKDTRIGVALPKSVELYVAILAVLKTGAAYVPFDLGLPTERMRQMSEEAGLRVILTNKLSANVAGIASEASVLKIDLMKLATASPAPGCLPTDINSDALAIVFYTSGSTGKPKGVMLEHRNIVHFTAWYRDYCAIDHCSVALQFAAVSFDTSLFDMFPTWFAGGRLVVPSEETRRSFDDLSELMRKKGVTHAFMPPAWLAEMPDKNLPTLAHLVTGGDVCDPDTISRWSRERRFHNIYGPTECTVLATAACLDKNSKNRNIGFPIANTCCYVLDSNGEPVRTGQEGELFIAGAGVGRGYLNMEELNRERYLPDAFSEIPRLMYKTGDFVRWTNTGSLEFIGRIDTQIKLRGFRVELGEIESVVFASRIYRHAAVVYTENKQVVGYVADRIDADEDMTSALSRLEQVLQSQLPDYMVPATIVEIKALPATLNGKFDRRALAALPVHIARKRNLQYARNDIEAQLVDIWAKILKLGEDEIGIHDSFFELGGDSILVAKLLLTVKKTLSHSVALVRFIENPTVASLSSLLGDQTLAKNDRIPTRVYSDTLLSNDIRPLAEVNPYIRQPRNVLLTGANGFLGCFIIERLISLTKANIFCLVRAINEEEAQKRLKKALISFGLVHLVDQSRIKVIVGDLEQPRLDLSKDSYHVLCNSIDVIYHNGAHVNHIYDYASLYAANVGSTLTLLRFATTGINKAFHYISTLSAASNANASGELVEAEPANVPPAFINNGYNLTKWVSECLVSQAFNTGVNAAIYRPGNIIGDCQHGICRPDKNRILRLIKGSLQLGVFPRWEMAFDLSPIDFLASAIVALSLSNSPLPVYHLHDPKPITWIDYISTLHTFGYQFDFIEPDVWRSKLLQVDQTNALFDVISFYLDEENEDIGDMSHIHWQRTANALDRLDIDYPEKNFDLLKRHFIYLIESGFFPKPVTATAANYS
jgi:amino acid adenylation domain-containing protein/thioester reductase-like protein